MVFFYNNNNNEGQNFCHDPLTSRLRAQRLIFLFCFDQDYILYFVESKEKEFGKNREAFLSHFFKSFFFLLVNFLFWGDGEMLRGKLAKNRQFLRLNSAKNRQNSSKTGKIRQNFPKFGKNRQICQTI